MQLDEDQIAALLSRPTEGLNVEIKTWFDPRRPEGVRKLIRAVFAIRNRNGGFLVIGFDNKSLRPDKYSLADPVETVFHVDTVQALISKYAFQPFEISVVVRERDGQLHPIIAVPEGVKIPAIVNATLKGEGGKQLLTQGELYFRTLNSNGTPSSAVAMPRDYADILEICFENREADIGRFVRRHLGSGDLTKLLETLSGNIEQTEPSQRERAFSVVDEGLEAFKEALKSRPLSVSESKAVEGLTMEVGLILEPEHKDHHPTQSFMNAISSANPQYTGWPIWLGSRGVGEKSYRPVVIDNAWQALIVDVNGGGSRHLEFMRLDPRGGFYLRRAMQDDLTDKVERGSALDTRLMLYRVSEVLAVGISLARATGWAAEDKAGFAFRWTSLKGRQLSSWANPLHFGSGRGTSETDQAKSFVEVPLDTPHSALAPYVKIAVGPLFAIFDGYEPPMDLIEECVKRLIERKM